MAWFATHVLFGVTAGFAIAIVAGCSKRQTVVLCLALGLWAVLPDAHHVLRLAGLPYQWLPHSHRTPWYDVFLLHYRLDQGYFQDRYLATYLHAFAACWVGWVGYQLSSR